MEHHVSGSAQDQVAFAIPLELFARAAMVVPPVALEHHGCVVHEEVDLEPGEAHVERRRRQVVVDEESRHAQLELTVGGFALQWPRAQCAAERGGPVSAATRPHSSSNSRFTPH